MEKINHNKRNLLKKGLLGLGILAYFGMAPVSAMNNMYKSSENNEIIIKDKEGRIIEITNGDKTFRFNPNNPMEYSVK